MFNELFEELAEINHEADVNMMRYDAYIESCEGQYGINLKRAELKVMRESGNDDDLMYLYEKVTEGHVGKIIDGIKTLIRKFLEFVNKIKDKLSEKFHNSGLGKQLDKLNKKIKMNPILARKKIKMQKDTTDEELSLIQRTRAKLNKFLAKIRSGKKVTKDEIDQCMEDYENERMRKIKTAGVVTVTVASIAGLLYGTYKLCRSRINKHSKDTIDVFDEATKVVKSYDGLSGSEDVSFASEKHGSTVSRIASANAKLGKDAVNAETEKISILESALKTLSKGVGKVSDTIKNKFSHKTESGSLFDDDLVDDFGFLSESEDIDDSGYEEDLDEDAFDDLDDFELDDFDEESSESSNNYDDLLDEVDNLG